MSSEDLYANNQYIIRNRVRWKDFRKELRISAKDVEVLAVTSRDLLIMALSHNTDLVGDIQSVLLGRDHDVGFLEAVGSDEGVDSRDLDVIEFLASFLDHWLVSSSVNDEHQCIVVFNGLDGALSAQRVLNDGVLVPGGLELDAASSVLGGTGESESLGSSEGGVGPNLVLSDGVAALLNSGGGGLGLSL